MAKDKILVTGGAGYIGSVLVRMLLEKGYKVKVFDKLYFGDFALRDIRSKIELVQGDVRKFPAEILEDVKAVVHMGSLSNDPTAEFDPKANLEINFEGTVKIAEACLKKKVKKFSFASSCAIYGFHLEGIADETFTPNPQSDYASSKLEAEKALLSMASDSFCPVVFRQATVYGFSPRMRYDLVVNTMTKDAYDKGKILVYHAGEMWRPLVDVRDVANVHILALETPPDKIKGEIFNVVYENYKILELAHYIRESLKDFKLAEVEVLLGTKESRSYRVSGRKLKEKLGFVPQINVRDASREIYNYFREGKYTDFSNPIYYNIDWMKLLVEMEHHFGLIGGKVF